MTEDRFDAFISYQRSSTGPLAAALQPALERFAKPWYRLRASRVFRDDASMSANTALWSTIEQGLTQSGWLILLVSPEAAASEYVATEVSWWLEHKSADRILLVLAKGELAWDRSNHRFDTGESTAIPAALVDAFREEPRWIDMRWFLEDGSQQSADPRFEERVVDLVASVRGVDRDRLVGENVRQHRRVRLLTRSAVTALSVLLVASLVAGGVAIAQSAEASAQRDIARDEARVATARQLAATSQSLADSDLVLSRLLADQAFRMNDDALTRAALLQSVSGSAAFQGAVDVGSPITALASTNDGALVAVGTQTGEVLSWSADSGELTPLGTLSSAVTELALSTAGDVIAAAGGGDYALDATAGSVWVPPSVAVWADGEEREVPADAGAPIAVSPSGDHVVLTDRTDPTVTRLALLDVQEGATADLGTVAWTTSVRMSDDQTIIIETGAGSGSLEVSRLNADDLSVIETGNGGVFMLRFGNAELSADGTWGAVALPDGTIETRRVFGTAPDAPADLSGAFEGTNPTAFAVSNTGMTVAIADTGAISVVSVATDPAEARTVVLEGAGTVSALQATDSGGVFSAAGERLSIWQPDAVNPLLSSYSAYSRWLSNASPAPGLDVAPEGAHAIATEDDGTSTWHLFEFSESMNRPARFLDWRDAESAYVLEGDQLILTGELFRLDLARLPLALPAGADASTEIDAARYIPASDELLVSIAGHLLTVDAASGEIVSDEESLVEAISASGRHLVERVGDEVRVVSRGNGEVLTSFDAPLPATVRYEGDALILSRDGAARVFSESGETERAAIADSTHIPSSLDDTGNLVATYLTDGTLQLSSLVTGLRLGEFGFPHVGSQRPGFGFSSDGQTLALIYGGIYSGDTGTMNVIDLSPATWTTLACETAGRDITADEWRRFVGDEVPADLRCGG